MFHLVVDVLHVLYQLDLDGYVHWDILPPVKSSKTLRNAN